MDIEELKRRLLDPDLETFASTLAGYDISEQDRFGNNILLSYLKHAKDLPFSPTEMIDLLVAHGLDVDQRQPGGRFGYSALHLTIVSNLRDAFDALMAHHPDVDPPDANGNTPLGRAVFDYGKDTENYTHYITTLLAAGADPDRKNDNGVSPRALAHTIANTDVRRFFPA